MLAKILETLAVLAPKPKLAVAGCDANLDVMFARRRNDYDDYDDNDGAPRRRSAAASRSRFEGGGSRKKSGDTMLIVGIVIGILVLAIGVSFLVKPKDENIKMTGGKEAFGNLKSLDNDIRMWRMKFPDTPEKLWPPQAPDFRFGSTFYKEYGKWETMQYRGTEYFYSVSADRKSYVVSCRPMEGNNWNECYCIKRDGLEADPQFFKATFKTKTDLIPLENGAVPSRTDWTPITGDEQ